MSTSTRPIRDTAARRANSAVFAQENSGEEVWAFDDPRWASSTGECVHCGGRLTSCIGPCPDCDQEQPFDSDPAPRPVRPSRSIYDEDEPTSNQVAFLADLVAKRLPQQDLHGFTGEIRARGDWNRQGVSEAIDALKRIPLPEQPERTNRYGGKCGLCGAYVQAEEGLLKGGPGNWHSEHKPGECPAPESPKAAKPEPPEGVHLLDECIYKVQVAKQGSGNLYCKRLVVEGDHVHGWEYEGRSPHFWRLSADTLLTIEQAARFGHLYGVCAVCGRDLTDELSIERGIGPICYGRLGG